MKKYTKPAIEVVEANLSTNCMLGLNSEGGYQDEFLSSGKKNKDYDDEDDGFSAGW